MENRSTYGELVKGVGVKFGSKKPKKQAKKPSPLKGRKYSLRYD